MADVHIDPGAGYRAQWPAPLDLADLLSRDPAPPRWIVDHWLPCGYATLLAGHGGSGKSSIALALAACIATGRAWCGIPVARRRVLYLSCEDRADVLHWRLSRIVQREHLDRADLAGLHLIDLVGHDTTLYVEARDGPTVTPGHLVLTELVATTGAEVLIVDGVSDTYGGSEIDRGSVKRYINALTALIPPHGAALLLHHVNRMTASGNGATTEGYSGSTGWHNSVRSRWYLRPERKGTDEAEPGGLILECQKSNLGRAGREIRYRWDEAAHMHIGAAVASKSSNTAARDEAERAAILAAIEAVEARGEYVPAAATGCKTAYAVLSSAALLPAALAERKGKARFMAHVERMRANDTLRVVQLRATHNHSVSILTAKTASAIEKRVSAQTENAVYADDGAVARARKARKARKAIGESDLRDYAREPSPAGWSIEL